jgi:4-hydroxy-tetrahydrodipicolinate synthase
MTMRPGDLTGVFTALVTPFTGSGEIDEPSLRALVRRQAAAGVRGIVPCGTTGESATLEPAEHERVVSIVADEARSSGRTLRVIAGAGSNDTRRAVALARASIKAGADALLVVTPYYNKPTQNGLCAHFRAVADAVDAPIVLYNVPGRTGVNLLAETTLRLAEDRRFAAIKEASADLDQAATILRHRPDHFSVLSGEDSLTLPMMALGADGVIAVVSNEAPELLVKLAELALSGQRQEAAALHARLHPLMRANFRESNPIPVKWALARLGLIGNHLRLPLTPLSEAHHAPLEEALAGAGLLPAPACVEAAG